MSVSATRAFFIMGCLPLNRYQCFPYHRIGVAAPRLARGGLSLSKVAQPGLNLQKIPARREVLQWNLAREPPCGPSIRRLVEKTIPGADHFLPGLRNQADD